MVTGAHVRPQDLGALPPNGELHRSVPPLQVPARANAFLTHGGMGSTLKGLYFDLSMVAESRGFDQDRHAAILAARGIGRHLPPAEVAPQRLRAEALNVVDAASVAERLAALKLRIRVTGGAAEAADLDRGDLTGGRTCGLSRGPGQPRAAPP